jgi:Tc toxin complex TcA C-terminal TcB-binding domain/Neuraminidase-like domain
MVLWYGTADAPAPAGNVVASKDQHADVTITAAVQPRGMGNTVQILYRVNGGEAVSVPARQVKQDPVNKVHHFTATLPSFAVGDKVEYAVVARSPSGQVPAADDAAKFPSSFQVVAAAAETERKGEPEKDSKAQTASETKSENKVVASLPGSAKSTASSPSSSPSSSEIGAGESKGLLPKAQLLALSRYADLTVAAIEKADSSLGKVLVQRIGAQRQKSVLREMRGASTALMDALKKIDFSPESADRATVAQAIDAGLASQKASQTVVREAKEKIRKLERSGRMADEADPDTPIKRHPLFEPDLKQADLYKLTDSVKLADAKAERLVAMGGSPALVDDDMLASLVAEKVFSTAEADSLGIVLGLCFIAGGSAEVAIEIKPKIETLPDIANVTAAEWEEAIHRAKAEAPEGLNAPGYAAALRQAATNLYPTEALDALNIPADMRPLEQALSTLAPLAAKNAKIFGPNFEDLDTSGIDGDRLKALEDAHGELLAFARRNPGLGLLDLLNGRDTPAEKIAAISKRLAVLTKLDTLNPDSDLMGLDYSEGSADRESLKTDGLSDHDAQMAVAHLKAKQRVHAMTGDVDHTSAIMGAGYASSCAIALDDPDDFRRKTGLDGETARRYHKKAASALSRASNAAISAIDAYDGPFHRMPVGNVRPGIKDHLKSIPGFSDLFGSQDYCKCTECQSILGAPAYFVDLMTFVEENLTGRVFRGRRAHDALNLKIRRPDLWTLPLTCANTNDLVSYLDIINPTLENYIAIHDRKYKGSLKDRNAIEAAVYEDALSKSHASFHQPCVLPLEKIDTYIEHFLVSRLQVARSLGADQPTIVMAALKISDALYEQLKSSNPDHEFLKGVYGIDFSFAGTAAHVHDLDLKELLDATGYTRADVEKAATSRFVTRNGATKIRIQSEKKNAESVQNDVETIGGLTADALDRLYRFTRLLRALPWTVSDLDLILAQLNIAGSAEIDELTLSRIAQILDLRARWTIPVDQLCALWSPIPDSPRLGSLFDRLFNFAELAQADGALPRPDIRFVHAAFSQSGKAAIYPVLPSTADAPSTQSKVAAHTEATLHPAISPRAHQNATERLLAALQVSDADLATLITNLGAALGAKIDSAMESDRGFALDAYNLTLLYRHALLARLLTGRTTDLFQLIQLAGLPNPMVENIDDLISLLAFFDWYQASGFRLGDLGVITQSLTPVPASYPNPLVLTRSLAAEMAADHALEFADRVFMSITGITEVESQQMISENPALFEPAPGAATPAFRLTAAFRPGTALQFANTVFAFQPGISGDQSAQIVAANPALFVSAPDGASLQLSASFNQNTEIAIPAGIPLNPIQANTAALQYSGGATGAGTILLNYHPVNILPSALAKLLHVDATLLIWLLAMTGTDLSSSEILAALQAGANATDEALAPLTTLIGQLIPLKVLFCGGAYGAEDLAFIQANPATFAIVNFNAITIGNIQKLSVYAAFASSLFNAGQDTTTLRNVLSAFSSSAHFSQAAPADMATLFNADSRQLESPLPFLTLPATAPEALTSLLAITALAKSLGLGGEALKLIISENYTDQTRASDAVLGAFRAQFHTEQQYTDRVKPFDDRIRERKRDALTDYLITCKSTQFSTLDDLYNYFLLDVQLEGCMETSWVVAAISSVQLYVYRCIMNLEQDQRDPSDPEHIAVTLRSEAAEEWEWRQNYRVWQANREVFLFPESYILPELRDDKTPLFEDLESTLLQQPINEQNVLDAYSTYLSGFDQLSRLQIAGSYHDIDKDSATDVLHLFGVTPDDPPTFYYRTIENASHGETEADRAVTYTSWAPLSLQIHCREISPVVYLGRLFVFWTQITTAPMNLVINSNSIFNGYKHTWRVKYSSLRLDGTWTPPQQLAMTDTTAFPVGDGIVLDPLLDYLDKGYSGSHGWPPGYDISNGFDAYDSETTQILIGLSSNKQSTIQSNLTNAFNNWAGKEYPGNSFTSSLTDYQNCLTPLYDTQIQTAPVDGYTVSGFQWDRAYPTADPDSQELLITGRNFCLRGNKVDFYYQTAAPFKHSAGRTTGQKVLCSKLTSASSKTDLYEGVQDLFPHLERYPWCSIVAKDAAIQKLGETEETAPELNNDYGLGGRQPLTRGLYRKRIGTIPGDPRIAIVNSSVTESITDAIIDSDGDVLLLQGSARPAEYLMKRLTTTLGESLCRALFVKGVDGLLSIDTQTNLGEREPDLAIEDKIQSDVVVGKMDFTGAMGTYFREVFFHVPFLIASQLNSQQNYSAALEWYRYIFDPTANDDVLLTPDERAERDRVLDAIELDVEHHAEGELKDGSHRADHRKTRGERDEKAADDRLRKQIKGLDEKLGDMARQDREQAEHDRVWRYVEFRGLDVPTLRQILTDPATIDAYEQNPFNPHAIARLRLSAYQKCIVMNYIDVLIEWGDSLFAEFQMETVNEATLLYVYALEILGPRPEEIGDCGQVNENERTYERIGPLVKNGSDFLAEMETYTHSGTGAGRSRSKFKPSHQYLIDQAAADHYFKDAVTAAKRHAAPASDGKKGEASKADPASDSEHGHAEAGAKTEQRHAPKVNAEHGTAHAMHWKGKHSGAKGGSGGRSHKGLGRKSPDKTSGGCAPRFASSVVRHVLPVFCVPPNVDLLAYWDLVEDRLYKIRHGMDITGALRQLSLFAPPIDPMLLVEATAAGLSLDDVLKTTSGDVPPYRFTYLIEKARQYASQVQSFGGALLSAIEKRDAQQLEVLRVTQQQNILAMTTSMKQSDVDAAQNAVDTLNAQLDTAQFRHDYFQGLMGGGLNAWETTQAASHYTAAAAHIGASALAGTGGVLSLLPQLGSPFAMKYGGVELGHSATLWSKVLSDTALQAEQIAAAAGMLGSNERRSDGWQHEVDMATKDITQLNTQLVGANIRLKIANKALDIHNKTVAQNQQVADFYTSRFSNISLYTWLATTMQTTYRQAYTSAYAMAKLAEQAYRFERNDDTTTLLSEPYWTQSRSGLLAGEMLLGDIQNMERRFIETNYRTPEITQSFSMMQISPAALLNLRQNASCSFDIPELCFDLFYPGQYCRKIKAVRLTIPCVTGPLTNVGATLTLTASKLRLKAADSSATPIQLKHSAVVATSTAQNDSGVFEFSFRDERYMPFEGAGAISTWMIELPDGFRQFDYQTISDVIVHISYTAQLDGKLRQNVEQKNGAIATVLKSQPLQRLFSLRQEFPSALIRLLHSPANTPLTVTIGANYLPYFITGSNIAVTTAQLVLRTSASQTAGSFALAVDGTSITGFSADPALGGLWSSDATAVFSAGLLGDHTITVTNAASLAPDPTQAGVSAAIDDTKLLDVMLYVEYTLASD